MNPNRAPFITPFFFILIVVSELPINMLIAVIVIITGDIVLSLILVYVNIFAKINKNNNVNIIDIITPFNIFIG